MGIYINGMEIPNEGEYRMTLYVCSDGSAYIDVASFPVDEDRFEVVPVPPHGRLIDADTCEDYFYEHLSDAGMVGAKNAIDEMPTIIPAEEVYCQYTDTAENFHWCGTHSGEHTIKTEEGKT